MPESIKFIRRFREFVEIFRECKIQILVGVAVGILIGLMGQIPKMLDLLFGIYMPSDISKFFYMIMPSSIIAGFTAGYLVSKAKRDMKFIAFSGFSVCFLTDYFLGIIVNLNLWVTGSFAIFSTLEYILVFVVATIASAPFGILSSLIYGVPAAVCGHFVQKRENLKLVVSGAVVFPVVFTIIVIVTYSVFPHYLENDILSRSILDMLMGKVFILIATGAVFSSIIPLLAKTLSVHNKISKTIIFGIATLSLIALMVSICVMVFVFDMFFEPLLILALSVPCLYLLFLKTWKTANTLNVIVLLGVGLASSKIINLASLVFSVGGVVDDFVALIIV